MTRAIAFLSLALLALGIGAAGARADDEPEPYARVIVDSTVIRSGPSSTFNRVYVAQRGEVFKIRQRATRGGFWFQVELPDGTLGYILGDTVYMHEVTDEEASGGRFLPAIFAPPPLMTAIGEIAVVGGVMGPDFGVTGIGGGFMAIRPAFYLAPQFGVELGLAASVSEGGRIFFGMLGAIVNVFPDSPIVPYLVAGGGYAISDPNADTFLLVSGDTSVAYGGGGIRIGFKYRITLRIEARAYAFFEPDLYVAQEELSGGATVFF